MVKLLVSALMVVCFSWASAWGYVSQIDPFTDENTSYVSLNSEGYTDYDGATLYVRCSPNERRISSRGEILGVQIFVASTEYLGEARFDYRVGTRTAVTGISGVPSTKGTSVFLHRSDIIEALSNWFSEGTFLIKLYDFRGTPHTYRFNTSGWSDAFNRINECLNYRTTDKPVDTALNDILALVDTYGYEYTYDNGVISITLDKWFSWSKLVVHVQQGDEGLSNVLIASYLLEELGLGERDSYNLYYSIHEALGLSY